MKSTSYLLDTSVLIPFIKNDPVIHQHLPKNVLLYASTIALGELYYGAERSVNVVKSLLEVHEAKKRVGILDISDEIARVYGRLRQEQSKKGKLIPENDMWIAATAMYYEMTLLAQDQHFTWIDTLSLEQW